MVLFLLYCRREKNILLFGVFEFGIFAILGTQLFVGKLHRCNDSFTDAGLFIKDRAMCKAVETEEQKQVSLLCRLSPSPWAPPPSEFACATSSFCIIVNFRPRIHCLLSFSPPSAPTVWS